MAYIANPMICPRICYKPEPIFYGSGNLFYGVELEIDKGGECGDYAEEILNTANTQKIITNILYDRGIRKKRRNRLCDPKAIVALCV